jgi:ATP-dependent Clp protease adapter protein ClpS
MPETIITQRPQTDLKVERPKMYKAVLVNDDYTPAISSSTCCARSSG